MLSNKDFEPISENWGTIQEAYINEVINEMNRNTRTEAKIGELQPDDEDSTTLNKQVLQIQTTVSMEMCWGYHTFAVCQASSMLGTKHNNPSLW